MAYTSGTDDEWPNNNNNRVIGRLASPETDDRDGVGRRQPVRNFSRLTTGDSDNEDSDEEEFGEDYDYEDLYDIADENRPRDKHCCHEEIACLRQFGTGCSSFFRHLATKVRMLDCKQSMRRRCSVQYIKRWLPVIDWLPKYRLPELQGDVIAGVTVGLTLIPQAIAYADIAGLPAQYGLYSSFIGCFVYVIFGSAKDVALGPTAIMSLLSAEFALGPLPRDPTFQIAFCLFIGLIEIVMSLLRLGFVMDFISFPVLKAFTSAAAITIAASQVKNWLGLKGIPRDFIGQVYWTLVKLPQSRIYDFILGAVCIVFIVLGKKLKEISWKRPYPEMPIWQKVIVKLLWIIGTARNVLLIVFASVLAAILLRKFGIRPFTLTGYIPPGIPNFALPKFTLTAGSRSDNVTSNGEGSGDGDDVKVYELSDMISAFGFGLIMVPIIGLIESMSISRVFGRRCNYKADANQELLAFGIANALTAFVSGYCITGSFSRTAVNYQSGVKTPAGGILSGIIVLLALQFMTPLFYFIPKAVLGVVVIMAVLDTISFHKVSVFWRTRKIDLIPWFVSFACCLLLGLEYGVLIGAAISLFILIYPSTRPKLKLKKKTAEGALFQRHLTMVPDRHGQVVIVELSNGLLYPAVEFIERTVNKAVKNMPTPKGVVLDMHHIHHIDSSAVQGIKQLLQDLYAKDVQLVLCNVKLRSSLHNRTRRNIDITLVIANSTVPLEKEGLVLLEFAKPDVEKVLLKSHLPHYQQTATVYEAIQIVFAPNYDNLCASMGGASEVSIVYTNSARMDHRVLDGMAGASIPLPLTAAQYSSTQQLDERDAMVSPRSPAGRTFDSNSTAVKPLLSNTATGTDVTAVSIECPPSESVYDDQSQGRVTTS